MSICSNSEPVSPTRRIGTSSSKVFMLLRCHFCLASRTCLPTRTCPRIWAESGRCFADVVVDNEIHATASLSFGRRRVLRLRTIVAGLSKVFCFSPSMIWLRPWCCASFGLLLTNDFLVVQFRTKNYPRINTETLFVWSHESTAVHHEGGTRHHVSLLIGLEISERD